jgi:hypothetical protein
MGKSIFELLGITSREDSFTDLIVNAFNNDAIFQSSFLENVLKIKPLSGWEAISRISVFIYSDSGKRKDCPDIVLTNSNHRKCAIVENKIFSGEGWRQTERYASKEFYESLKAKLSFPVDEIGYFYLTLDGALPVSNSFVPISYDSIMNCDFGKETDANVHLLLTDLKELLETYYTHTGPKETDIVLDYLKINKGLINSYRNFQLLAYSVFGTLTDYNMVVATTSNRGSGYIPICLISKSHWASKEYPSEMNGYSCFDIHYELQWDTREDLDKLTFYIHYHTNPYMTQNEISENNIPQSFLESFEKRRKLLLSYLTNANLDIWHLSLTPLRIGYFLFEKKATFAEVKSKLIKLLSKTTSHIDKFLEESSKNEPA